ncbi:MAG TPA: alpha/beta hydrolase [Candidatus Saccharimonadales bacterium]
MRHIIYLPGLGDHYDPLRKLALKRWRDKNTRVTLVPMHWSDKRETYEQKYQRVADVIEATSGKNVTLVGESAGGAMAMFVFSRHQTKIRRVVTICGYNHGAADIHRYHKYKHPAFYLLMPHVDEAVKNFSQEARSHITTIYSKKDRTVSPDHSQIKDAREIILRSSGHLGNIARALIKKLPINIA